MHQNTFVIGDVQGCYDELVELIKKIDTTDPGAQLIFLGDLVNRGPKSLETLRFIKNLGSRSESILGNHDLHLLAVANGIRSSHPSDTLNPILHASDREELLSWIRHRPMALSIKDHLLVHAGVFSQWTNAQTLLLAQEVETTLRAENWLDLIQTMYGNDPALWNDNLGNVERHRCIINGLTRMRFCFSDGTMDFALKEGISKSPENLTPWFDLPQRQTQNTTIIFGHWSTLGLLLGDNLICLDTGCVWGGKLTALRLEDRLLIQVESTQQRPSQFQ